MDGLLGALGGAGGGGGLEALLGGGGLGAMMGDNPDKIWEMPMIQMIAFHPRPEQATHMGATSGPIRQGTFDVPGNAKVSYSLYLPPSETEIRAVVYNFHGNAEVCTDIGALAELFGRAGAALLSVDYRGFAWGTGQASLTQLCGDAEACWEASGQVLEAAGCAGARRVAMGRSIGATCAVHLAATRAADVHGLVVDSGLMSIKQLPMVSMLAPQVLGPQAAVLFPMIKEPFDTIGKLAAVSCPTLVMHGDQDEIVPIAQGLQCHERCASADKKLRRWPTAGHNNVNAMHGADWAAEVLALIDKATEFDNALPAGALVEAHSLSKEELNGLQGRVLGPQGERVRVDLGGGQGEKALKPANLKVLERSPPPPAPAPEPFPVGATVEAHSLSVAELNGLRGKVLGRQGERVQVKLPEPHGEKALKPANLKVVEEKDTL